MVRRMTTMTKPKPAARKPSAAAVAFNPIELDRRSKRLTQQAYADRVGTSKQMICYYETGHSLPGPKHLPALARECGLTARALLEQLNAWAVGKSAAKAAPAPASARRVVKKIAPSGRRTRRAS